LIDPVEKDGGVELLLYVQPRARKTEICGFHNGMVKLKIAAAPVDNAANDAVVGFFASRLHIPKSSIRIVSGDRSRQKRVRFEMTPLSRLREALGEIFT